MVRRGKAESLHGHEVLLQDLFEQSLAAQESQVAVAERHLLVVLQASSCKGLLERSRSDLLLEGEAPRAALAAVVRWRAGAQA